VLAVETVGVEVVSTVVTLQVVGVVLVVIVMLHVVSVVLVIVAAVARGEGPGGLRGGAGLVISTAIAVTEVLSSRAGGRDG
jgi:hypothetical protein